MVSRWLLGVRGVGMGGGGGGGQGQPGSSCTQPPPSAEPLAAWPGALTLLTACDKSSFSAPRTNTDHLCVTNSDFCRKRGVGVCRDGGACQRRLAPAAAASQRHGCTAGDSQRAHTHGSAGGTPGRGAGGAGACSAVWGRAPLSCPGTARQCHSARAPPAPRPAAAWSSACAQRPLGISASGSTHHARGAGARSRRGQGRALDARAGICRHRPCCRPPPRVGRAACREPSAARWLPGLLQRHRAAIRGPGRARCDQCGRRVSSGRRLRCGWKQHRSCVAHKNLLRRARSTIDGPADLRLTAPQLPAVPQTACPGTPRAYIDACSAPLGWSSRSGSPSSRVPAQSRRPDSSQDAVTATHTLVLQTCSPSLARPPPDGSASRAWAAPADCAHAAGCRRRRRAGPRQGAPPLPPPPHTHTHEGSGGTGIQQQRG